MGKLDDARSNLGESIARYLPAQRSAEIFRAAQDPGVACRAYLAMTEWLLGFPERAQSSMRESVALAEELGDPFNLAFALCFPGTIVSEMCGGDTGAVVERGLSIATEGGFSLWVAHGKLCRGYVRFKERRSESALDELRQSVVMRPERGIHSTLPYYMTLLARAYGQIDKIDEGLRALDEAQESVEVRGEVWWEAEVQRLRGELLLSRSAADGDDVQACFKRALDIARDQKAKSLELRAATSLARLFRERGRTAEVRTVLGPVYDWFTEGFDTPDLIDAKALLDELS